MQEGARISAGWKRFIPLAGLVVVAALLLAACGSALPGDSDPAATNELGVADFQIVPYNGNGLGRESEGSFSELLSLGKPVVLNMWAGLCPPCRLEMPDFQVVSEELGEEVMVFGLDVGPFTNLGTVQDGRALVQELGITYPTGTTTDPAVVQEYQLLGMPTTYFITPDGQLLRQWTGLLTAEKLSELVQELLDASAGS